MIAFAAAVVVGTIAIAVGILLLLGRDESRSSTHERETLPERCAKPDYLESHAITLNGGTPAAWARRQTVTGEVLIPEPLFEAAKPSRQPLEPYSWTVRKQDDGRYSVLPFDKNGLELWQQAVATDIEDPTKAWDIANQGRRALGWKE
jgi:hypothetical protein